MTINQLTQWINLAIAIISGLVLLSTIITFVIKWIKDGNWKKINVLFSQIPELVIQAEKMFGKGKGADKFNWVLTMLRNIALKTHTRISDEAIGNQINDVVDATNNVNVDKFPFEQERVDNNSKSINDEKIAQSSHELPTFVEVKE